MNGRIFLVAMLALAAAGGCGSTYTAPLPGADLAVMGVAQQQALKHDRAMGSDPSIGATLNKKPLASFPAAIAVARVQASGYATRTTEGFGRGAYSVVTQRDVETDADFAKLAKLPMIRGLAPMNRLVLPSEFSNDTQLRSAAAALRADLLLIYTLDTSFHTKDANVPVTVISLGTLQPRQAAVRTTASAVLMDTRNGYIYGLAESSARDEKRMNNWTSHAEVDAFRTNIERQAFSGLVGELEKTWKGVVTQYAGGMTDTGK